MKPNVILASVIYDVPLSTVVSQQYSNKFIKSPVQKTYSCAQMCIYFFYKEGIYLILLQVSIFGQF